MKRTRSVASTGRRISSGVATGGPAGGERLEVEVGRGVDADDAGRRGGLGRVDRVIVACAKPERTKTAYSASGSRRSSV